MKEEEGRIDLALEQKRLHSIVELRTWKVTKSANSGYRSQHTYIYPEMTMEAGLHKQSTNEQIQNDCEAANIHLRKEKMTDLESKE